VIAHEPPLEELLDDREQRRAQTDDIIATYLSEGPAAAWVKFLADANITLPEDDGSAAATPEPAERDPQEVAAEHHFFVHELRLSTHWQPDIAALRAATARIVVGIGDDSAGQVCDLTSTALAAALGIEPTMFPGGHIGFVEDPIGFATRLRGVLREG